MNSSENKKVSSGLKKIVFKSNLPGQHVNDILDKYSVLEMITYLGWINEANQEKGTSSRLTIYQWIKDGGYAYVVDKYGNKVKLIIAETDKGTKYVKTEADNTTTNNLLSLPECK